MAFQIESTTYQAPFKIFLMSNEAYDLLASGESIGGQTFDENALYLTTGNTVTGSYLSTEGGVMSGSLILKGDPSQNLEAATKQYVDNKVIAATQGDYVARAGDIMTGNLTIQKSSYPAVMFDNTTTNSRGIISAWENSTVIQSVNIAGTSDNRRGLFIKNSNAVSSVASSLTLRDWIDGSSTEYKIYGEHNKPLLTDLSGTLGVANGGTGQTTARNAANAFMNALETRSSTPTDDDYYISQYVGGGTTTTTYHRRPMSALWTYINGKVGASYPTKTGSGASGTWGISISGNAATATTATSATKATQDGNGATISSTYLKLSGGTMTGNITRNYVGQSWINVTHGHACAIKLSAAASGGSASCLWSVKTNAGAWGCGGLSGNDNMYFSYGTDANYNASTNTLSGQITFTSSGGIVVASNTEYTTAKCRNTYANTSAMTASSTSLANGNIYLQYT